MPYADEIARVVIEYGPSDQSNWPGELALTTFMVSHHHNTGNTFSWSSAVNELASGVLDKLVSHWSDLSGYLGTGYQINGVKAVQLDNNGKAVNEGFANADSDHTLHGGGSGGIMPPEVAVCVSLWGYEPGTFTAHKGRKRGRMYLPYIPGGACSSQGKVTDTVAAGLCAAWQDFFNDVQGSHVGGHVDGGPDSDYWNVVIASSMQAEVTQVGWISVDNHFDSQRRRQHQSPATRVVNTISHAN